MICGQHRQDGGRPLVREDHRQRRWPGAPPPGADLTGGTPREDARAEPWPPPGRRGAARRRPDAPARPPVGGGPVMPPRGRARQQDRGPGERYGDRRGEPYDSRGDPDDGGRGEQYDEGRGNEGRRGQDGGRGGPYRPPGRYKGPPNGRQDTY